MLSAVRAARCAVRYLRGIRTSAMDTGDTRTHTQKKTLMEESSEGRKKSEWGLKSGVFQRLTSSTAARSNINCGEADKSSSLFSRAFPLLLRDR